MKKRWIRKLRGKTGETIAETLIATLIAALALTMLAGAIGASARMVTGTRTTMQKYRSQELDLVKSGWEDEMVTALGTLTTSGTALTVDDSTDTGLSET